MKKEVREILAMPLIDRDNFIEYLQIEIDSAHNLKDKEKFPGNTDADVQFFENKIELYTNLIKMLENTSDYSKLLRLHLKIKEAGE